MASLGDNVRLCLKKRKKSLVCTKISFGFWFVNRIWSGQPVLEEDVGSEWRYRLYMSISPSFLLPQSSICVSYLCGLSIAKELCQKFLLWFWIFSGVSANFCLKYFEVILLSPCKYMMDCFLVKFPSHHCVIVVFFVPNNALYLPTSISLALGWLSQLSLLENLTSRSFPSTFY